MSHLDHDAKFTLLLCCGFFALVAVGFIADCTSKVVEIQIVQTEATDD